MSNSDIPNHGQATVDPPDDTADGATVPTSVKEAQQAAEQAFRAYRSGVDDARNALSRAEKEYRASIKRAERARGEAAVPAKIASLGVVRKVTLSETTIRTPKGEFPLTSDVEA